jgi:hypothetical protein
LRSKTLTWMSVAVVLFGVGCASEPARTLADELGSARGTSWYGVYFRGRQKCGYARIALDTRPLDGVPMYVYDTLMDIHIEMGALRQKLVSSQVRYYRMTGELARVEATTDSVLGKTHAVAIVDGKTLRLTTTMGGHTTEKTLAAPNETLLSALAGRRLIQAEEIGGTTESELFEPTANQTIHVTSKLLRFENRLVGGVNTRLGVVESRIREMNMTSTEYVTTDGDVVETVVGGIFTLRKEPENVAKDVKLAFDALRAGITPVETDLGQPGDVTFLKLRISGVKKDAYLVDDARQTYERGGAGEQAEHVVTLRPATAPKTPRTLPMRDLDAEVAAWLRPTPAAQSDAPEIVAAARRIVGDETDAFKAAKRINQWVFKHVEKKGLAAISNAAAVLKQMEGDCSEHSVLFVALCRAAGIPAREVTGIGYAPKMGGFGYHAWGEVFVGEWVQMDPAWGQNLVDPTHLKFGVGEEQSMFAIGSLFGSLKIKVVAFRRK